MTSATDAYIATVLHNLPRDPTMREQIALELRGLVDERVAHGQSEPEALRQLGDPAQLAASYASAVPLQAGPLGPRLLAKVIDLALAMALGGAVAIAGALVAWLTDTPQAAPFALLAGVITGSVGFLVYTVVSEASSGATFGKRLMQLQVVRESGAPIGLGQALVRQLPWLFQVFWIDVLFVPFTDRHQRAFELLSKTRVVRR